MSKKTFLSLLCMILSIFMFHYTKVSLDTFTVILIGIVLVVYSIFKKDHFFYFYYHYDEIAKEVTLGLISGVLVLLLYSFLYRPESYHFSCDYQRHMYHFQLYVSEVVRVICRGYTLIGIGLIVYFLVLISLLPEYDKQRKPGK